MPTVIDEVVAPSSAYNTSGNGGRKITNISTNEIVFVVKNGTTEIRLYKKVGTNAPVLLANFSVTALTDVCIENVGNGYVGILYSHSNSTVSYRSVSVTLGTLGTVSSLVSGQTAVGNVTMIANNARTELHVSVSTKNSTYQNSFNIIYAKGAINTDGSVAWSTVEQVTTRNGTDTYAQNPSIVIKNGNPIILYEYFFGSTTYQIVSIRKTTAWQTPVVVYDGSSYGQYNPSACVAPDGRIWVAWHGYDTTNNIVNNIRVSYSYDGLTWSAMQKLTSGNSYTQIYPSITVNKNNETFILWQGRDSSDSYNDIRMIKYSGGSWGDVIIVSEGTIGNKNYPSVLYDPTLDFSVPLFIYQDLQNNKIGFYGTWAILEISVKTGYIGKKSDKNDILSYSITADTMLDITEKINGATIATRTNPISEQQFTVSLSQDQWDAIKYGNNHVLTISMGDKTWTYTFDKRLDVSDDILSAVKGVQDLQDHLNGIKSQLGTAISAKGGTVNDTDSWNDLISTLSNLQTKKWASGTYTVSWGANESNITITIPVSLSFTPTDVFVRIPFTIQANHDPYTNMYGVASNYMSLNANAISANGNVTTTVLITSFSSSQIVVSIKTSSTVSPNYLNSLSSGTITWYAYGS